MAAGRRHGAHRADDAGAAGPRLPWWRNVRRPAPRAAPAPDPADADTLRLKVPRGGPPPPGSRFRHRLVAAARATAAVAAVFAIVGVLLLFGPSGPAPHSGLAPDVVGALSRSKPPTTPPPTTAPATTRPSSRPKPAPAPSHPPLTVLNNSRITGLAHRAAARFAEGGWQIALIGNFTGRLWETTVFYAAGQQAAAEQLARQFPGLTRVQPRFVGLPGSGLTVVLTRYSAAYYATG